MMHSSLGPPPLAAQGTTRMEANSSGCMSRSWCFALLAGASPPRSSSQSRPSGTDWCSQAAVALCGKPPSTGQDSRRSPCMGRTSAEQLLLWPQPVRAKSWGSTCASSRPAHLGAGAKFSLWPSPCASRRPLSRPRRPSTPRPAVAKTSPLASQVRPWGRSSAACQPVVTLTPLCSSGIGARLRASPNSGVTMPCDDVPSSVWCKQTPAATHQSEATSRVFRKK
mmetsp:Transcript_101245/g.261639  ORF Transcript_101245/g.261639 Transcript_101245/m.261639 type:complete len:224 (+) Transcript_101245:159-830(+)